MCTMTIVSHERGTRVVFNRDEQRTRPDGLAPRLQRSGSGILCYPIDPRGGGTWIGVNDTGVMAALLNRSGTYRTGTDAVLSRGAVVPAVLRARAISEAVRVARAWLPLALAPFRIVVCQERDVYWADGGGGTAGPIGHSFLDRPVLFTSSSLGDEKVFRPRKGLFEQLFARMPGQPLEAQRVFHRHQWPDHPEVSVLMHRADARTVSRTQVDVQTRPDTIRVHYEPVPDLAGWTRR
jgi:hypothetical protein